VDCTLGKISLLVKINKVVGTLKWWELLLW